MIQNDLIENEDIKICKLLLYPATLLIIVLPYFAMSYEYVLQSTDCTAFSVGAVTFVTNLFGFINALVYGCQRKLYRVPKKSEGQLIEINSDGSEKSLRWNSVKEYME